MRLRAKVTALVVTTVLAAAGLGACSGDDEPAGAVRVASTLGPGEGAINLVSLSGYVENGGSDPRVDWVTPFEKRTGCKVGWKAARSPEEMADLMSDPNRRYDGVSAPPEVSGRLIADRQVVAVNPNLVDGYKKLEPRLRGLLKRDGRFYGVPFTWGSNLLAYDTRTVQPAPSSWAALFEPEQARRYSGRLIMRDSPLAIAEAALYLKDKERKLHIGDPYSLTAKQLDAAGKVLAKQRPHVKEYWQLPADAISAFAGGGTGLGGATGRSGDAPPPASSPLPAPPSSGTATPTPTGTDAPKVRPTGPGGEQSAALGVVWPYQADVLNRAGRPVQTAVPSEGVTGWMNAWMIGARVQHPNCMYQWLQWTASPDVQQQVAEWTGVAPANPQACSGDRLKREFCDAYRVGDRGYLDEVIFAHTPAKACGTGKKGKPGKGDCTDYAEWTKKWIEATNPARRGPG
ncbi:extracellular solute-binding protein [Spirillospora sp. NBC_01491]|uniref:extracellular solute-binding protein n=1 Tax=Spirillospora sp. NBC_01491 TaxID=2976007 RepID=UPI002E2F26A7|nr:extracellular solute-binding protein [Spirillospora sp. NBC_01491]